MSRLNATAVRLGARLAHALLVALALLGAGCSGETERAREQVAEQARAALVLGEASEALRLARRGLADAGTSAELQLLAGEACLKLERFSEAAQHAARGLAGDGSNAARDANLQWVLGMAHLGLYKELRNDKDWRKANAELEMATRAGTHRADAAYALVLMHADKALGSQARLLKFARLLARLEPDSPRTTTANKLLAAAGLEP